MATKQTPMGQGMVKQAAGDWAYTPLLPNTPTTAEGSKSSPQAPPN